MQERAMSICEIMSSIVPITRFNRGEASKIFDEVEQCGVKFVLKNNDPVCVLIQPERYEEMVDALEDYALFFEAERRMHDPNSNKTAISHDSLLNELGISQAELDGIEVEIE